MLDFQAVVYPEPITEYRKSLIAEIDRIGNGLQDELRQRYGRTIPPDCEVKLMQIRHLELTRPLYDELTRVENFSTKHRMVAQ